MQNRKNTLISTLRQCKVFMFYITVIFIFVFSSFLVFVFAKNINTIDTNNRFAAISFQHLLGTDELGRDIFLRTIYGGFVSLTVGLFSAFISSAIGIFVGAVSGYLGGIIDNIIMRAVEVIQTIPWIILVTICSIFFEGNILTLIIIIGCTSWIELAKLVRAETMIIRKQEYVVFSKINGANFYFILKRHIFPGILPLLIVYLITSISSAILTEASLSFIGIGVRPPMPSWGNLLRTAQETMFQLPQLLIVPGVFICLTVYSLNKIGSIIEKALYSQEKNI